jgi:hypothetical protein
MPYEVELYGNTGAGKTVLLTALYHLAVAPNSHIRVTNYSPNLDQQRRRILQQQDVERTALGIGENLSFQLIFKKIAKPIEVVATAHAGEDHVPQTNETYQDVVDRIKAQFISNDNKLKDHKLLVIVVNPFLHDLDLAWKAFRNLVAYLQNTLSQQVAGQQQPLAIKEACYAAANILFHIQPDNFKKYFINPDQLFENLANARLVYDCQATDPEQSFQWENCMDANAAIDFNQQFESALEKIVGSQQGDRVLLQNLMRDLKNSMVVLSHVDLASHLKSIDVEDFDKVFNLIFANPNRSYRRQLLAKNLILHVGYADNGEIQVHPTQLLTQTASQFYENIKSFAIEPETAEPLSAAWVEEESDNTFPIVATESLVKEIAFLRESLASQMHEGVSQVKQGQNELGNLKTEIGLLTKQMGDIYERMSTVIASGFIITAFLFLFITIIIFVNYS